MKNNKGQSTAEFILAFAFMSLFVIVFIQMAENYVKGYVVHYATYMTSRSYLVQDEGSNSIGTNDSRAESFAKSNVLRKMLKINSKYKITFRGPYSGGKQVLSGTVVEYSESFSPSDMVGGTDKVLFKSESFLGRTFSSAECAVNICKVVESLGASCVSEHVTAFDNGC
tara:strand:- start:150 stop:656 length:507 start_codon:yes stop_codon:yes gene_type:complete